MKIVQQILFGKTADTTQNTKETLLRSLQCTTYCKVGMEALSGHWLGFHRQRHRTENGI